MPIKFIIWIIIELKPWLYDAIPNVLVVDCPKPPPNAGAAVVVAVWPNGALKAVGLFWFPNRLIVWFCAAGCPNELVAPKAGAVDVVAPNAGVVEPNRPPVAWGVATPNGLFCAPNRLPAALDVAGVWPNEKPDVLAGWPKAVWGFAPKSPPAVDVLVPKADVPCAPKGVVVAPPKPVVVVWAPNKGLLVCAPNGFAWDAAGVAPNSVEPAGAVWLGAAPNKPEAPVAAPPFRFAA